MKRIILLLLLSSFIFIALEAIPIGEIQIIDIPWILNASSDAHILVGGVEGSATAGYWTEDEGIVTVTNAGDCNDISDNGRIAGKTINDEDLIGGCWWDIETLGLTFIGSVPNATPMNDVLNTVNSISNDGSTIVGLHWYSLGMGSAKAYKWTEEGGCVLLPDVMDWSDSRADCVSTDGSLIGGYAAEERSVWRPVLWNNEELIELPYLIDAYSDVYAISPDGIWCAGYNGNKGIVWNNQEIVGFEGVEPTFIKTKFRTITNDGWCGGEIANWNTQVAEPIIWNPQDSLMNAVDFFESNGVTIPSDYNLFRVRWISNDHLTFVCNGTDLNNYQYKSCIIKIPGPHSITNLKLTTENENNIHLTWNFEADTPNAENVIILRNGVEVTQIDHSITEYYDNNLNNGNYEYQLYVTYDSYDNSVSRTISTEILLSNPIFLDYAFEEEYNILTLNWNPPYNTRNIVGYEIYRNNNLLIEVADETTYLNSDIPNGEYYYKVRAIFEDNTFSEFSNELQVWISDEAPVEFTGTITNQILELNWASPNSNNPNISDYNLYKNSELLATTSVQTTSFTDEYCEDGDEYYVTATYYNQFESVASDIFVLSLVENINNSIIPATTKLVGNYPNPFNPSTSIKFNLHKNANVEIEIFNVKGQLIKQLKQDNMVAGQHSITWNGYDFNGNKTSSGILFYRLKAGDFQDINKMILLK